MKEGDKMAHNEFEGILTGTLWRAQRGSTEILYFRAKGETHWFRMEYDGPEALARANHMAGLLGSGGTVFVGVDYNELHLDGVIHNLVEELQVNRHEP